MPGDEVLVKRVADHVTLVTINRPQARNAVDRKVAEALEQVVLRTESDPDVWAVILTGAGNRAFCAGADLKAVSAKSGGLWTKDGGFAGFVDHPRTKPWIAAVNGFALAGGTEIALACDLIVATEGSMFGLPEVKRGLIAAAGGLFRLPRALPKAIATELILTGRHLEAHLALQFGLINRLVSSEKLIDEALSLAVSICESAPLAVRESLAIVRHALDFTDEELRDRSVKAHQRIAATEDYAEGPRAFIEKRKPFWKCR